MPKPKRIKNLLKSIAESSLEASPTAPIAPTFSHPQPTQPQACTSAPIAHTTSHTQPIQPQACTSAPITPTASYPQPIQPLACSTTPINPTASHSTSLPSSQAPPQPRRRVGRESNHYWSVDAIGICICEVMKYFLFFVP